MYMLNGTWPQIRQSRKLSHLPNLHVTHSCYNGNTGFLFFSLCPSLQYNYLNLSFHVLPCPPGYDLQVSTDSNAEYTCVCTGARDDPFAVLDCDENRDAILLRVRKLLPIILPNACY